MKRYDALILGTGIAGLGCAIGLARAGRRVLAIGKKGLRGESSPAAAGILDPLLEMKPANPLLKLGLAAFRRYPSFVRELVRRTRHDVGFVRTGLLYAAMDRRQEKILRKRWRWQKKIGFPVRWMSRGAVLKAHPVLARRVHAALFYPTLGKVHPAKLMRALHRLAVKLGVGVMKFSGDATLRLRRKRVVGVRVGGKNFESKAVVNATGSWAGTNPSLRMRPPVLPARGQIFILKGPHKISTILHSLEGAYLVPWGKEECLAGSTIEFVGFRARVTAKGIRDIQKRVETLAPSVRRLKRVASWAGLRPYPKGRLPFIGPTRISGLYLATGYYRSGILMGPYAGSLLAKGILSGKMPSLLAPFDPRRRLAKRRRRLLEN